MCCLCKCKSEKIEEFQQTTSNFDNTCSFMFRNQQYHGNGRAVAGLHTSLYQHRYMWNIFDSENEYLFSFGTDRPNDPINTRKLAKWMKESLQKRGK